MKLCPTRLRPDAGDPSSSPPRSPSPDRTQNPKSAGLPRAPAFLRRKDVHALSPHDGLSDARVTTYGTVIVQYRCEYGCRAMYRRAPLASHTASPVAGPRRAPARPQRRSTCCRMWCRVLARLAMLAGISRARRLSATPSAPSPYARRHPQHHRSTAR